MKNVFFLNKKEGETPLQALLYFRQKKSRKSKEYKDIRMTYAGRLDPMASGVLLVLAGEEIKNKEKYLALDKEYEFKVLFGFATDTYDILGKITSSPRQGLGELTGKEIKNNLKKFLGEITQKYPLYSSKTVSGRPLFSYARKGEEVKAPERKIFIQKLKLEKIKAISNKKLLKNIEKRIKKVKGDFRQNEISKIWKKELLSSNKTKNKLQIASFKIKCSSGTYVRGLAHSLGVKMGIPAIAFSIKRTKIGKHMI